MAAEDVELREFVGWVKTTAEINGWQIVTSLTAANSNATGPTLILDRDRVIAVKLKTDSAYSSKENAGRGGLSRTQAEVRDRWSGEWHTWSPSRWQDAVAVLSGGGSHREAIAGGNNAPEAQS